MIIVATLSNGFDFSRRTSQALPQRLLLMPVFRHRADFDGLDHGLVFIPPHETDSYDAVLWFDAGERTVKRFEETSGSFGYVHLSNDLPAVDEDIHRVRDTTTILVSFEERV
jgi:hypothetical protein